MTVYLDIVLIENILMNYIILFATGFIQKVEMKQIRLIISSLFGGIYAIASYLNIIPIYSNFFMKILLSIIMVYIAFNPQNYKKMLKTILLFYLTSFVMGGCALALLYVINPQNINFENGVLVGTYPLKVTIIAGIIGFAVIQIAFALNKRQVKKKDMLCDLEISINNQTKKLKAYVDSGNMLKEPITNIPVIIVEKEKIKNLVNIDLEKILGGDNQNIENLNFRIIPFNSIGKQNGMLIGIKPDFVKVIFDDNEKYVENVIIGLYDKKINKEYNALIGLELLEGDRKNADIRIVKQNVRKVHSKRWK